MNSTTRLILAAAAIAGSTFAQLSNGMGQGDQGYTALTDSGSLIILHGKVTMEDGETPPPKTAAIVRLCSDGLSGDNVALTDKNGLFTWPMRYDPTNSRRCTIKADLQGYSSSSYLLPDMNAFSDPNLAPLMLSLKGSGSQIDLLASQTEKSLFGEAKVPGSAQIAWGRAEKALGDNKLAEAERQLQLAVNAAPKFAQGWNLLGLVLEREKKPMDAATAYRKAIEIDPKLTGAYLPLARQTATLKDWVSADQITTELIKQDTAKPRYPEARLIQAMARSQLKNYDGAIASANEAIQLDGLRHKLNQAEYVLAFALAAKPDYAGASEHMKRYLALLPANSPKADEARQAVASLELSAATGKPSDITPTADSMAQTLDLAALAGPTEAWVPGGRKALALIAGLKETPSAQDFFTEYCRALANEETVGTSQGIPQYLPTVRAYMATVTDLLPLGNKDGEITKFTLSLANEAQRVNTEHVLQLLGWKLMGKDGSFRVEPGDQPSDSPRQHIPKLFGIDEVSMQDALESGKSYQFEIPTENARLVGGNAWGSIFKQLPTIAGGIAGALTLDVRIARAYAGLGSMSPDAADAVVRAVGIPDMVLRDSEVLSRYAKSIAVAKDAQSATFVAVPGGPAAEPAWRRIVGASPRDPQAFFRALFVKNEGRLAAFYFAVWSANQAHQQYLTANEARIDRFYNWYRDSDELKFGINRHVPGWHTDLLRQLPLEANGAVHFPGSRKAWVDANKISSPDDEVLLGIKNLEGLVPIARLEQRRGSSMDDASVTLLAEHYTEWKSIFPYFEQLPSLGHDEFASLQTFSAAVSKQLPGRQNQVLGEWYSIVELIARGYKAGSLDGAASARAFRRACDGLTGDDHATKALAGMRDIAAGPNLTEGVANLLRLTPEGRTNFQRVLELQGVPRVDPSAPSPDPAKLVNALSGYVYAAAVDSNALLISEDPSLVSRHQFVAVDANDKRPFAFAPAALVGSNTPPGTFLRGGFGNFDEVAHSLANGGRAVPPIVVAKADTSSRVINASVGYVPPAPPPVLASTEISGADNFFRTGSRLVEAYATVTDSRGRYVDNMTQDQFTLLDQGKSQMLVGFESNATPVSVALLLDTTGSMSLALPALKNAALKLIGELRPVDSVAVYSFNKSVTELQPFTSDMNQAKRAILSTEALGETALYDALARVSRDLSGRTGKKVIVVFTDGDDNSSLLTTDTAILRAKATGVPVYTIAQGEALQNKAYLAQLADLSKATGGESFAIKDSSEIGVVFEKVSEDLSHGYLLEFEAQSSNDRTAHTITVQVKVRGDKVRARETYNPE